MPFDQEMINIEFEQLESTEAIDSARVATATSHKEWRNLKFNRFFSRKTLEVYYNQGELTRSDHQIDLIQIARFAVSPYGSSTATKPRAVPQFNPGPSPGQINVICPGIN